MLAGIVGCSDSSLEATADRGDGDTRLVSQTSRSPSMTYARGQSIGRYVIVEMLGQGGMGRVYAAFDPELDRKVAIKVLRDAEGPAYLGAPGTEAAAGSRLLREAQALAKLSHPNVLPVFDVGAAGASVFIAMEYVEGSTLSEWLGAETRSWRMIVHKFMAAGRGLAAAHAAGLIHRDFKPQNVLVGVDGSVRVMDFGLARRLDADLGEGEVLQAVASPGGTGGGSRGDLLTVAGTVTGTPPYMAPEHHRGAPVDASADQYSFCVAMYEALYGTRPFVKAAGPDLLAAKERLRLQPLPPGAEGRVPRWLRRVVLRGLQPEPARRWPSMAALLRAADRDPRRTASRVMAVGSGLALALLGGWAYGQSEERREELCSGGPAALQGVWDPASRARMQQAFVQSGVVDAAATWARAESTLQRYADAWVGMHRHVCQATHVRHEQSDEALDLRMACLHHHLRGFRAVTDLFEKADAQVVNKAYKLVGSLRPVEDCARLEQLQSTVAPPSPEQEPGVEEIRDRIAEMDVLDAAGKYDEALAMAKDAFEEAKQVAYRPVIAEAQHFLGGLQGRMGHYEAAVDNLREAGWLAEGAGHDEVAAKAQITVASLLGYHLAQPQAGLVWGRHAEAVVARLEGRGEYEAMLHAALASVYGAASAWDAAYDHDRRALEARIRDLGPDHYEVASQHNNLAIDATSLGRPQEAIGHYEQAIAVYHRTFGPEHPHIAIALGNLANTLRLLGRYHEAREKFDESLAMLAATVGPEHPFVGIMTGNLAKTLVSLGHLKDAHEAFERATRIQEASMGPKGPYLADVILGFAESLVDDLQLERADDVAAKARSLVETSWDQHAGYNAGLLYVEGRLLAARQRHAEAIDRYRRGLERLDGERHTEVTEGGPGWRFALLMHLGRESMAGKAPAEAIAVLGEALAVAELGHDPTQEAEAAFALAQALLVAGEDRQRARALADRALMHYADAREPAASRHRRVAAWLAAHF